jgi:transposase
VKNLRRIKNHIKAVLLYYGIALPEQYDNMDRKTKVALSLSGCYHEKPSKRIQIFKKQYLHICTELRGYVRKHYKKDYYLLRSVPGVGPFIAIAVLCEVDDLRRFKGVDRLVEKDVSKSFHFVVGKQNGKVFVFFNDNYFFVKVVLGLNFGTMMD